MSQGIILLPFHLQRISQFYIRWQIIDSFFFYRPERKKEPSLGHDSSLSIGTKSSHSTIKVNNKKNINKRETYKFIWFDIKSMSTRYLEGNSTVLGKEAKCSKNIVNF